MYLNQMMEIIASWFMKQTIVSFREDLEDEPGNFSYEWLKVGLKFESEEKALQMVEDLSYRNKVALVKAVDILKKD